MACCPLWLVAGLVLGATSAASPSAAPINELRGVVGDSVSISLPTKEGAQWEWRSSRGDWLFASPYRVRFQPMAASGRGAAEIWVFPLVRPGETLLEFAPSSISSTPSFDLSLLQRVRLHVLTPYEAQQHPLSDLLDALLIH